MENLPVGKKLLVGFGIVVAMILVILGVIVFTSVDRNNQLQDIKIISDIQTQGSFLLTEINEARVDLRTVFTSSDYQNDEYNTALTNLQTAEKRLDTLEALTAQMDPKEAEVYDSANKLLRQQFALLYPTLENIHNNDLSINDNVAQMSAAAEDMATTATKLVDTLTTSGTGSAVLPKATTLGSTTADADTPPKETGTEAVDGVKEDAAATDATVSAAPAAPLATGNNGGTSTLVVAQKIISEVQQLRIISAKLTLSQDITVLPQINEMLDAIESDVKALETKLTSAADKAALSEVSASLAAYRQETQGVVDDINNNTQLVTQAREELEVLTSTTKGAVEVISETVNTALLSIIQSSIVTMIIMIAVAVLAIVVAIIVGSLITRAITRPLGKMVSVLQQAGSTGNLAFSEEVRKDVLKEAEAKDELGTSLGAFAKFVDRVSYISKNLEAVAAGDLTADIEVLSDEDTMGGALRDMTHNLNSMFSDIHAVAEQVASSSGEIANGSQFLAQGATEQASTIEEISANIASINEQANQSAQTSQEVATDSVNIRQIAQQGNDQMQRMMEAVQEINTASQSIEQVIKVIDDIAFQTNILALNAAVEAARAGEQGKGFAVVADEVRNLAGKSSDAAKETATLISASVQKAELGLSITEETAKSLAQIVEGIQRTSDSLQTVSEQSQGACASTSQVNEAVDQVARVIQENSATSQQSAASSQELSSQAQMLKQLITRFKLRGDNGGTPAQHLLPPASAPAENMAESHTHSGDMIF